MASILAINTFTLQKENVQMKLKRVCHQNIYIPQIK